MSQQIDITKLDWQPNPNDYHAAIAHVQAGERKLRLDTSFLLYKVHEGRPTPVTGIIEALKRGDLDGMKATLYPVDDRGDVVVSYAINSAASPWVDLDTRRGVEVVNAKITEVRDAAANPKAEFMTAANARFREREAAERDRRQYRG